MASRAMIRWQVPPSAMAQNAEGYAEQLIAAVHAKGADWASRIADDARQSAPWTDRTGAARAGIHGTTEPSETGVRVIVAHGVPYGRFLERRWGGKYAAIVPALQRNAAPFMADMAELVE